MLDFLLRAGRAKVLIAVAGLIAISALSDWAVGTFSLGILYIVPMMLAALILDYKQTLLLALFCAFLRSRFDVPSTPTDAVLRFAFASVSYFASALIVTAMVRNRRMVSRHLEEMQRHLDLIRTETALRREAEEQLRELAASSPAAILTLDSKGTVLAANRAADALFAIPDGQTLTGRAIVQYLPVLFDALRLDNAGENFRTTVQSQGRRETSDIFLAQTWFSSYTTPLGARIAAIIVDISEEMRDREEQNLRRLHAANRITAAAVSHELRNLCSAISLLGAHVGRRHNLTLDEDFQALANLVKGLEKLADLKLQARSAEDPELEQIPLQSVLDDLRIVIESEWSDIDGTVRWRIPAKVPHVIADPHGLLQAFLNLAQNSLRAVRHSAERELEIAVCSQDGKAQIRFQDTGPGIPSPERLFQPFQEAAYGAGLGLYVSRAIVRGYGGDLRFEPRAAGSCFVVELQVV
jgi:signal transduction histidine kinase